MDPYEQWSDQEIWKVADEVKMLTEVILERVAHIHTRLVIIAEIIFYIYLCACWYMCVYKFKMENSNTAETPTSLD